MKALVYTGVETLDYREVPDPVPASDTHLIKIDSVGICGSDMHAFLGHDPRRPAPLSRVHEGVCTIVGGALDGSRVTINPLVTCGTCAACVSGRDNLCSTRQIISMPPREGAFAEYVKMPEANLVVVPDAVPFEKAALAEPIACGWHAVRLGKVALGAPGESGLVIGGGAIGVGAALSLKAQGVAHVTLSEPNDIRRAYLEKTSDFKVISPDQLGDQMFDLVIDGVGYDGTRATASAHARPGGVILHIGLGGGSAGLDIRRMTLQEIAFIGTYTYTAQDFRDTAAAIFDGRLGPLDWPEARSLADGAAAFADIRSGSTPAPKIILKP